MKNLRQTAAFLLAALAPALAASACAEQPTAAPDDSPDNARDDVAHVREGRSDVPFSAVLSEDGADPVPMELGLCPVPPDCN